MKIIEPSFSIETPIDREAILKLIEAAGRTCYKSEHCIKDGSASEFVRKIVQVKKHESVIEHASITVRFICDRGVSHELVRHRLAAYSQESTRYCNYGADKFGKEITVIRPPFWEDGDRRFELWKEACETAEMAYFGMLGLDATPQEARSVLPNSLKTEIVMTCNLREWRHVFKMRCSPAAHPQMRQLMIPLRAEMARLLPEIFGDLMESDQPQAK